MLVKLSNDERRTVVQALGLAQIFYEITGRKEEYFEVHDLARLLFFSGELVADLSDDNVVYHIGGTKKLKDLLEERESREQGCKMYQFRTMPEGLEAPDDPDDAEADILITRRVKKIAKEYPEL